MRCLRLLSSSSNRGTLSAAQNAQTARNKTGFAVVSSHSNAFNTWCFILYSAFHFWSLTFLAPSLASCSSISNFSNKVFSRTLSDFLILCRQEILCCLKLQYTRLIFPQIVTKVLHLTFLLLYLGLLLFQQNLLLFNAFLKFATFAFGKL